MSGAAPGLVLPPRPAPARTEAGSGPGSGPGPEAARAPHPSPHLVVEGLGIAFRQPAGLWRHRLVPVLEQVSLRLAPGEVLAVVGASGAGKSLLAQAILGLLPPAARQEGRILFRGEALTPGRQAALRGRQIALVPQSIAWLDPLAPVGRQLGWAARRAGVPAGAAAIRDSLARFGLGDEVARAWPHTLSGGMARRVMLAMARLGGAPLLIADEPTTGLDAANAARVLSHLRALADAGHGVLVISHDLPAVLPRADRVCILRDGRVEETARAAAFQGEGEALASAYARALWRALPQNRFGP